MEERRLWQMDVEFLGANDHEVTFFSLLSYGHESHFQQAVFKKPTIACGGPTSQFQISGMAETLRFLWEKTFEIVTPAIFVRQTID